MKVMLQRNGCRKSNITGGTVKDRAKTQITSAGVLSQEQCTNKINFINSTENDYTSQKCDVVFNNITVNENKTVTGYQVSGYDAANQSYNYAWSNRILKKGKKYKITYHFYYLPDIDELWYMVNYASLDSEGNVIEGEGDEVTDEIDSSIEDIEDAMQSACSTTTVTGEPRNVIDFTDVLSDTDYYTNVGDIDPNSSAKVEEKIGTVVKVITNIGIILSILMPAILGIKYMLGSVEEKADYKKDMIPYFVGAVLLFGVCTVVKILQSIGNSINNI